MEEWEDFFVSPLKFTISQISLIQERFLCWTQTCLRDSDISASEGGNIEMHGGGKMREQTVMVTADKVLWPRQPLLAQWQCRNWDVAPTIWASRVGGAEAASVPKKLAPSSLPAWLWWSPETAVAMHLRTSDYNTLVPAGIRKKGAVQWACKLGFPNQSLLPIVLVHQERPRHSGDTDHPGHIAINFKDKTNTSMLCPQDSSTPGKRKQ